MTPREKTDAAVVRRVPTQERSKKRVEAILDAAALVFSDVGFDAATTEVIAEKAGTSIGSVYQFYPNKLALFEALAARSLERSRQAFDALLVAMSDVSWTDALEMAVDGLGALHESDPAFRALLVNFHLYGVFEKADVALMNYSIERVEQLAKKQAPRLTRSERKVVATTVVNVITGALFLLRREPPAMKKKLLDETKLLLRRYLQPYTGPV